MKLVDLTQNYLRYFELGDLNEYERSRPELFQHYFKYWGDRDSFSVSLNAGEIEYRKKLILGEFRYIEKKFSNANIDLSDLNVFMFVGQNCTNGHSAFIDNTYAVFLPIETYESKAQVRTFVPHEIIHALHYSRNHNFYFSDRDEKERMSRLLITEGLATYGTKMVMDISTGEALWADYRSKKDVKIWSHRFEQERKSLAKFAFGHFNESSASHMFYVAEPPEVGTDREGYLLGLEIIEKIVDQNQYSLKQLLSLDRSFFEKRSQEILLEMTT